MLFTNTAEIHLINITIVNMCDLFFTADIRNNIGWNMACERAQHDEHCIGPSHFTSPACPASRHRRTLLLRRTSAKRTKHSAHLGVQVLTAGKGYACFAVGINPFPCSSAPCTCLYLPLLANVVCDGFWSVQFEH